MVALAICLLVARGHTEQITAVAVFEGAVFATGTAANVTINIRR
ncbi:hypothetical protein QBA38_38735 [Streptomyces stelliscabiei]